MLFCVVTTRPSEQGRFYRLPNKQDLAAIAKAEAALVQKQTTTKLPFNLIPDEPLPPQGTLGFRVQLYGMKQWGHLFSPRQALLLITLNQKTREVRQKLEKLNDVGLGEAVQAALALNVDKMADYGSSLRLLVFAREPGNRSRHIQPSSIGDSLGLRRGISVRQQLRRMDPQPELPH